MCIRDRVDDALYCHIVGSLIYLTHSRADLSFVVSMISRFMQQPLENHWHEAKRILQYLQGTLHYGVFYSNSVTILLSGYIDSDSAGDSSDRR